MKSLVSILILLASVLSVAYCSSPEPLGAMLFKRYLKPYPIGLSEVALADLPELRPAYEAYRTGDYETVVDVTARFTRQQQMLPLPMMALSVGYLYIDSLDGADKTLAILEAHPDLGDDATWYRALIRVRREQYDDAKPMLEQAKRLYDPVLTEKADALLGELP